MRKRVLDDLAAFGGPPLYERPLHVGQFNLPSREAFDDAFHGILQRRFFTNHGPLVQELDQSLAQHLEVRHAVSVMSGTVALMVAMQALDLKGKVIVPAFTHPATVQAVYWAGLEPVFCDVNPTTGAVDAAAVEACIERGVGAVLGVHLWGRPCDPEGLQELCQRHGLSLFFDAAHAMGCALAGRKVGGFGQIEIFSFNEDNVVSSGEGGCLTTNDDVLAARIRTVRNFHVSESFVPVPLRINGKMSEAQAALVLLGLADLPTNIAHNRTLYEAYRDAFKGWTGVRFVDYAAGIESNHQFCVLEVPAGTSPLLLELLRRENVMARRACRGMHRMPPYDADHPQVRGVLPNTDRLAQTLLQLPLGAMVTPADVQKICALISFCLDHVAQINDRLDGEAEAR